MSQAEVFAYLTLSLVPLILIIAITIAICRWVFRINDIVKRLDDIIGRLDGIRFEIGKQEK